MSEQGGYSRQAALGALSTFAVAIREAGDIDLAGKLATFVVQFKRQEHDGGHEAGERRCAPW